MVGRLVLETLPAVADDPADVGSVMAVVSRLADDPGECHKNSVSSFDLVFFKSVFLNRRAAAWYRALASIIPGRERFSWN